MEKILITFIYGAKKVLVYLVRKYFEVISHYVGREEGEENRSKPRTLSHADRCHVQRGSRDKMWTLSRSVQNLERLLKEHKM